MAGWLAGCARLKSLGYAYTRENFAEPNSEERREEKGGEQRQSRGPLLTIKSASFFPPPSLRPDRKQQRLFPRETWLRPRQPPPRCRLGL